MAETYTAWNGDDYPWPPPDGWELKSDGRYWPADAGAPDTGAETIIGGADFSAPAPTPSPAPAPAPTPAPGPPPGPAPAPQGFGGPPPSGPSPIGAPPQYGAPGTAPGAPVEKKGVSTGVIVLLGILGVIVLGIGGCVIALAAFANEAGDQITEAAETFEANQAEARAEVSLSECRVVDGMPQATGMVANRSGGRSDYNVEVVFTDESGRRLTSGFADIESVDDGADVTFDAESFDTDVTTAITCGLGDVRRVASR